MQEKNANGNFQFQSIEAALKPARLGRYMPAAGYDREQAIKIYLWNCELSEAFQFPLHIAEVVCRNSIQKTLQVRLPNPWYEQTEFTRLLDPKQRDHLKAVVGEEREQHEKRMSDDHIVSSVQFGFWDHLTTKRFARTLWLRGIKHNFPNAYARNLTLADVNELIQRVRRWRNRIAHHRAIFDKDPARKYEETVRLIEWTCKDTADWVRALSTVEDALARSPLIAKDVG
jgi:hypothetical protein